MNHTITPELIIHYGQVQSENDRLRAELRAADDRATEYINALSYARAELAELRARVPAICFPRQPNGEGGWVIDANYVAAIHKDCFPIEWQPCEEEVEAVLLAVERAAPVTPAAVPEDVAKDAEISDSVLLKAYTTASNGEVLSHSWRPIYLRYARIGIAAILAADTEGRKDE